MPCTATACRKACVPPLTSHHVGSGEPKLVQSRTSGDFLHRACSLPFLYTHESSGQWAEPTTLTSTPVNAPDMTTPIISATPDTHDFWWTTSGDTSFLTSGSSTFAVTGGSTFLSISSNPNPSQGGTPPSNPTATTTSFSPSATSSEATGASGAATTTSHPSIVVVLSTSIVVISPTQQAALATDPVCIGDGVDATAGGILATLIVPSAIGLLIWVSASPYPVYA